MESIKNRYEIVALVEAKMCNPNGDPDMANRPRMDFETNKGIITDVAFKSRMRNYVLDAYNESEGLNILMKNKASLNKAIAEAVLSVNNTDKITKDSNKKQVEAAEYMCSKYWDVRTFGGVLNTGLNAGQVRGAVQVGMALSVDPIDVNMMTITRKCFTEGKYPTLKEYDEKEAVMNDDSKRTMGDKTYIPYGLYVLKMTVSANLAEKVGFTENDLKILLESVVQMYNDDASASKMGMSVLTPVVIFKHVGFDTSPADQREREAKLGCVSAYKLFDLITIEKKDGIDVPRAYSDYNIKLKLNELPSGVECGLKHNAFEDIVWYTTTNETVDLMQ